MKKFIYTLYLLFCFITFFSSPSFAHGQWATAGSNIYNTNSGKVIIGTSTAPYPFTVGTTTLISDTGIAGSDSGLGALFTIHAQNPTLNQILFDVGSLNQGAQFQIKDGLAPVFGLGLNAGALHIGDGSGNCLSWSSDTSQQMCLTGNAQNDMTFTTDISTSRVILKPFGVTVLVASSTQGVLIGGAGANGTLSVQGINGINPFDIASSTGTSFMRMLQNGNLGIGTTTPSQKLEVNGNIKLSGSIVSDGDICIGICP